MHVYIVTNKTAGTLYIGVTGNLVRRIFEHRNHALPGFTNRYNLTRLVWYESYNDPSAAIQRAKSLKRYARTWKLDLVQKDNPNWRDLWSDIVQGSAHGSLDQLWRRG